MVVHWQTSKLRKLFLPSVCRVCDARESLLHNSDQPRMCMQFAVYIHAISSASSFIQVRVAEWSETVSQKAFASLYGVSISRVRRIAEAASTSICAQSVGEGST